MYFAFLVNFLILNVALPLELVLALLLILSNNPKLAGRARFYQPVLKIIVKFHEIETYALQLLLSHKIALKSKKKNI